MGGKGKGGAPPGGDAITWGPAARSAGWGWDKEQPAPAAAPEAQPAAAPAAAQEKAAPAAAAPPDAIGEPAPPQATSGAIQTTQDTGSKLAQTLAAPSMWTDQMKAQQGGAGSMTTTGQV